MNFSSQPSNFIKEFTTKIMTDQIILIGLQIPYKIELLIVHSQEIIINNIGIFIRIKDDHQLTSLVRLHRSPIWLEPTILALTNFYLYFYFS